MSSRNFLMLVFLGAGLCVYGAEKKMSKKVLLVIASDGFQPVELSETQKVLEKNSFVVAVASDKKGSTKDALGHAGPEITLVVSELKDVSGYAGIFLIGGKGALDHLDNQKTYDLMRAAKDAGILWGAICISPRILCNAGLLESKKITGWDGDQQLVDFIKKNCSSAHVLKEPVVVDGNLITANGPGAAEQFGQAIVTELKKK